MSVQGQETIAPHMHKINRLVTRNNTAISQVTAAAIRNIYIQGRTKFLRSNFYGFYYKKRNN